jgi:YidC/Oxa1 family membrane protein insertase
MFKAIDYFFHVTGNFGFAILIVTVLVKLLFFPLGASVFVAWQTGVHFAGLRSVATTR